MAGVAGVVGELREGFGFSVLALGRELVELGFAEALEARFGPIMVGHGLRNPRPKKPGG